MFQQFYNIGCKNQPDTYLQGLMEIQPVASLPPDTATLPEKINSQKHTVVYHLTQNGRNIPVSEKCILAFYTVTNKRLRRISNLLSVEKLPKDLHGNTSNTYNVNLEKFQRMKDHIECLPTKGSHYTKN